MDQHNSSNVEVTKVPANSTWLQALMLRDPGRWSSRLGALYMRLKVMGRGQRRRLGRAAAGTLAGASGLALMALLAGPLAPPVHAATINVDATCSLVDAIKSANTDAAVGTCEAGSGADTIVLAGNVTLTASYADISGSLTGLPQITSTVTIESAAGSHFTIARNAVENFRLIAVGTTGDLTLRNVTLSNGYSVGDGGAIFNYEGVVTLDSVVVISNTAVVAGGAIRSDRPDVGQDPRLMITNSVITGNVAGNGTGGGLSVSDGVLTMTHSMVSHNSAPGDGGGIYFKGSAAYISHVTMDHNAGNDGGGVYFNGGTNLIVNSTIISNTGDDGGGVGVDNSTNTILHTTIVDNYAGSEGGGLYSDGGDTIVRYSIISGNREQDTADMEIDEDSCCISVYDSVLGHAGVSYEEAISGDSVDASNFIATWDRGNVALADIFETPANNGGPELPGGYVMLTHKLVADSPAIDFGAESCDLDDDQVGTARPQGEACDVGAMEFVPTSVFVSTWAAGSVDGLSYGPHDILQWDGSSWSKWFDGSEAGLDPSRKFKHNINAIWISDTESAEFAVSFAQNQQKIGDLGWVDGYDILLWDGDAFGRWFEGEKVGLNVKAQEKIDGLHVLAEAPAWSEFGGNNCEAYLLISTQGPGIVPAPSLNRARPVLKFGGEDVLGFCATNLGPNTTGFWEMVLDGSADGVAKNNIDSISMKEDGTVLYLTSKKSFSVDEASGGHSMVYAFDLESEKLIKRVEADGDFSGPLFDVFDAGMSVGTRVDALYVSGDLSME